MKLTLIAFAFWSLVGCSTISKIKKDGGYLCSVDSDYYNPLPGQGATFTQFEYSNELSGDYTSLNDRHGGRYESRVSIRNEGLDAKNISIRMILEAGGIEIRPYELSFCSISALERCMRQEEDTLNAVLVPGAYYWIVFKFSGLSEEYATLEQTIFIGESEPDEVLVSQMLKRGYRAYNCIF